MTSLEWRKSLPGSTGGELWTSVHRYWGEAGVADEELSLHFLSLSFVHRRPKQQQQSTSGAHSKRRGGSGPKRVGEGEEEGPIDLDAFLSDLAHCCAFCGGLPGLRFMRRVLSGLVKNRWNLLTFSDQRKIGKLAISLWRLHVGVQNATATKFTQSSPAGLVEPYQLPALDWISQLKLARESFAKEFVLIINAKSIGSGFRAVVLFWASVMFTDVHRLRFGGEPSVLSPGSPRQLRGEGELGSGVEHTSVSGPVGELYKWLNPRDGTPNPTHDIPDGAEFHSSGV